MLRSQTSIHLPCVCAIALCGLMMGATGACTLRTSTPESVGVETTDGQAASSEAPKSADESEGPTNSPASSTATGSAANSSTDAGAAAAGGNAPNSAGPSTSTAATPIAGSAGASSPTSPPSSAPSMPSATTGGSGGAAHQPATPQAGSSGMKAQDAGIPQPQAASGASTVKLDKCNADLAECILDAPLNYDGCLRRNADNGCPEMDAGTPASTVLDTNGNPISQVCQAELAKCIMKLPTPDNALACTEVARSCK